MAAVKHRPSRRKAGRRPAAKPRARYRVFHVNPWPSKGTSVKILIDPDTLEARVPRQTIRNPITGRTVTIPETAVRLDRLGPLGAKTRQGRLHEAAGELAWYMIVRHT